ncbi:hypothetical protein AG1IA_03686 [Rhizoctonia solani AG-1 IA]|uniref:Uncharacterized protein n=1 Tax=Thanatephorus cucumeris (strain AG1-IA) TaxID=983506 RepID=L8WWF0_THACA|nr:hypothetical protein AG1IA_03686 [Rhizoctonia solani AG-1 IA]
MLTSGLIQSIFNHLHTTEANRLTVKANPITVTGIPYNSLSSFVPEPRMLFKCVIILQLSPPTGTPYRVAASPLAHRFCVRGTSEIHLMGLVRTSSNFPLSKHGFGVATEIGAVATGLVSPFDVAGNVSQYFATRSLFTIAWWFPRHKYEPASECLKGQLRVDSAAEFPFKLPLSLAKVELCHRSTSFGVAGVINTTFLGLHYLMIKPTADINPPSHVRSAILPTPRAKRSKRTKVKYLDNIVQPYSRLSLIQVEQDTTWQMVVQQ